MNKKDQVTRERILNEAEALFAKNGYDAVSVREITTAACCNLAAVNYHFGNKQKLYLEVFRARWVPRAMRVQTYFRESLASRDTVSTPAVAQALAEAFLKGPLSDDERQRQSHIIQCRRPFLNLGNLHNPCLSSRIKIGKSNQDVARKTVYRCRW